MSERMSLDALPEPYRSQAAAQMGAGIWADACGPCGEEHLEVGYAPEDAWTGSEQSLQDACNAVLREMKLPFYHPFDARRSNPGWPDLTVCLPGGRVAFIELKNRDGRQSADQIRVMGELVALGHYYGVARSVRQMLRMLAEAGALQPFINYNKETDER